MYISEKLRISKRFYFGGERRFVEVAASMTNPLKRTVPYVQDTTVGDSAFGHCCWAAATASCSSTPESSFRSARGKQAVSLGHACDPASAVLRCILSARSAGRVLVRAAQQSACSGS